MVIVKEECATANLPTHNECTRAASFRRRVPESTIWNERKAQDNIRTPGQETRGEIELLLAAHNAANPKYFVTFAMVVSSARQREIVAARVKCMRYLRDVKKWSFPRIGKYLGGRDHTTVMHHCGHKKRAGERVNGGSTPTEEVKHEVV